MFNKDELELLDAALTEYWLHLNDEYQRGLAKGRHKAGWQTSKMQKIGDLQSKIFYLLLGM